MTYRNRQNPMYKNICTSVHTCIIMFSFPPSHIVYVLFNYLATSGLPHVQLRPILNIQQDCISVASSSYVGQND